MELQAAEVPTGPQPNEFMNTIVGGSVSAPALVIIPGVRLSTYYPLIHHLVGFLLRQVLSKAERRLVLPLLRYHT